MAVTHTRYAPNSVCDNFDERLDDTVLSGSKYFELAKAHPKLTRIEITLCELLNTILDVSENLLQTAIEPIWRSRRCRLTCRSHHRGTAVDYRYILGDGGTFPAGVDNDPFSIPFIFTEEIPTS